MRSWFQCGERVGVANKSRSAGHGGLCVQSQLLGSGGKRIRSSQSAETGWDPLSKTGWGHSLSSSYATPNWSLLRKGPPLSGVSKQCQYSQANTEVSSGNFLAVVWLVLLCSVKSGSVRNIGRCISVFPLCQSLLNNNKFTRCGSFIGYNLPGSPFLDSQLRQTLALLFASLVTSSNAQIVHYRSSSNTSVSIWLQKAKEALCTYGYRMAILLVKEAPVEFKELQRSLGNKSRPRGQE